MSSLHLTILSAEAEILSANVDSVSFPGICGCFMVLKNHAPIIAALGEGAIEYAFGGGKTALAIKRGFVKVKDNEILVCAEV